jgi:RNA polymerase subunit RPABC4/transcription elongation factor Spt4
VEPLKKLPKPIEQVEEESEDPACHLCGLGVQLDVRMSCPYGCGKQFHTGCHRACKAVYRGDRAMCEVCGVRVQAADA